MLQAFITIPFQSGGLFHVEYNDRVHVIRVREGRLLQACVIVRRRFLNGRSARGAQ